MIGKEYTVSFFVCTLIGYLMGTVNPSYFIARKKGMDIRERGSGNAGASNALIVLGKMVGVLCALFDIGKAFFAIWLCEKLFPAFSYAFVLTGASCILGHIFPFYMGFRGGKGLACLGGMILKFDWRIFLIMLAGEFVVAVVTKYICFVPMSASVIFSVLYGWMRNDWIGEVILLAVSCVILWKHRENIRRIREGTEARFSMLWNREREEERLREKYNEDF